MSVRLDWIDAMGEASSPLALSRRCALTGVARSWVYARGGDIYPDTWGPWAAHTRNPPALPGDYYCWLDLCYLGLMLGRVINS